MESAIRRHLADDGTATVVISGEIDLTTADDLADELRAAVAEGAPRVVRVDLHEASFLDSTGLGALIEGYRVAEAAGARFLVVDPTPALRRLLAVTGLTTVFGLVEPAASGARATGAQSASGARATGA